MKYRLGTEQDKEQLRALAVRSWSAYRHELTPENWKRLYGSLASMKTYTQLLEEATCIVCTTDEERIIGMAFLVSSGHPTDIYEDGWSYIRFVTVDPEYSGRGIGGRLTKQCVDHAKQTGERIVALHTSEMMQAAQYLYENMGFSRIKEIPQRLGKRYWLYQLRLEGRNDVRSLPAL